MLSVPGTLLLEERQGAQHPGPACSLWCESPSSSGGASKTRVDHPRRQQLGGSLRWRGTARQTCGQLRTVCGKGAIIGRTELCCLRRGTGFSPAVTILSPDPHLEFLSGRGISQKGCGRKPCQARRKVATALSEAWQHLCGHWGGRGRGGGEGGETPSGRDGPFETNKRGRGP